MDFTGCMVATGLIIAATLGTSPGEVILPVWTESEVREFDGRQGVRLEEGLRSEQGFALDFEVFFSDIEREHQVFRQDGLLLLRMDPPSEGGKLSFFVNIDGALEPRLRSVVVEANRWYRVTTSWNGDAMWLRVDDRVFRAERRGGAESWSNPLDIGGPHSDGAAGLRGQLRNVRVYHHPLTVVESLLVEEPNAVAVAGALPETPAFEFEAGLDGWRGVRTTARAEGGRLQADVSTPGSVLIAEGLDYEIGIRAAIVLRLTSVGGGLGTCYVATDAGTREAVFSLKADGRAHVYVLWMDPYPEWRGRLKALGLLFSPEAGNVGLDFVRCNSEVVAPPEFEVHAVYATPPLPRVGRDFTVRAELRNLGGASDGCTAALETPAGLRVVGDGHKSLPSMAYGASADVAWTVRADDALCNEVRVTLSGPDVDAAVGIGSINVAAPREVTPQDYVPVPQPVTPRRLVGAHYCPLWKEGSRGGGWTQIEPFREREPLLGWYDEHDPEVTDWEIKWAVEHGIGFFVYCWYRAEQGGPVEMRLGHAIHEGLFYARYRDYFKFCIMWENQWRGHSGVSSEQDLFENLLPFWIDEYFKNPGYVVIDNKPLLFIYRPEYVIEDLGGAAEARTAFEGMRQACRDAGFDGLYILGEDRGTARGPLERMVDLGLDYSFSYCWPVPDDPDGPTAIAAQERYWQVRKDFGIIPDLLTVSMGWDSTPWHYSYSKWRLTPDEFATACRKADAFMNSLPADSLASQVVLLDNWNEFGEGHYIAPHRQYGFGYLDAVRAAFSDAPAAHEDLVPEDLGLGPYNTLYAAKKARAAEGHKGVFRKGGDAPGLVAWWTFDEEEGCDSAWDYTGHGHGGRLCDARRVEGFDGKALECAGGSVEVAASPDFAPRKGLTIACRLKTDVPNQDDRWFANRIHDGHVDAGFRFGLNRGRLTWAVPQSRWSHHVTAEEPLPLGRWVHVAGTCDNRCIRIYMDGRRVAELARWGVVKDGGTRLTLGNYDVGHAAHFEGLLDDVRVYDHALTDAEIVALAQGGTE
ncbi:MAG TPA: glycoside hydrolase family 99-like domain-containing protein [Candidatus Hydrogenedentes bacterium]|nr:glycoside hydrolase family 99-like domain-containing protein [Candidatus Hydrogenedentota bacterium]